MKPEDEFSIMVTTQGKEVVVSSERQFRNLITSVRMGVKGELSDIDFKQIEETVRWCHNANVGETWRDLYVVCLVYEKR